MRRAYTQRRVRTFLVRPAVVVAVAAAAVVGVGAPASAHVSVSPSTATQGDSAQLTFRVPNEKVDASTVKVEVQFPQDTPIASVSLKPVAGWTADVQRATLPQPITGSHGEVITEAVSLITWTATSESAIAPGQYQEFEVSAGPLPMADQVIFKALQTYSDGEVARWIDEPTEGVELEHPAPIVALTPEAGDAQAPDQPSSDGGSGAALGLAIAGLVIGLAGLGIGLLAYRRTMA